MKVNKYNPKIPVRTLSLPRDWEHPELRYRVTVHIRPAITKLQVSLGNYWVFDMMGGLVNYPSYFDLFEYDENKKQVVRDLTALLPGCHAVNTLTRDRVFVYCDEWIDPVVMELAKIENMGKWTIENRRKIPDSQTSVLTRVLISRVA